jgi:hypothetical protein
MEAGQALFDERADPPYESALESGQKAELRGKPFSRLREKEGPKA